LQVPIGTFTGWNLRAAGYAEEALCGGTGSFFPLLETQNDRSGSWDDRPSFMERYGSAESYLAELEAAAAQLVEERFLLPTDAADMLERARNARLAGTGSGA